MDGSHNGSGWSGFLVMSRANRNVWSAALSQAKNEGDRLVCANVFGLHWSTRLLAMMECAALSSYLVRQPRKAFPVCRFRERRVRPLCHLIVRQQTWQNHQLRSSRWSVDVGIANAISKPGLSQASSAGQSRCRRIGQHWRPIGFILGEHGPGHACQLIR
jgi:hypothetical protein